MIVDTHVHVTSDDRTRYPRVADAYDWPTQSAETLLETMRRVGIDRALLVQPYFTYHYDNGYQIDAALAYPERFRCVCVIDPWAPGADDLLSELVETRGVRGVRIMHARHHDHALRDSRALAVWRRAETLGIPICVAARLEEMADARWMIERVPAAKVALEHMWVRDIGAPPYARLAPAFAMAEFPNVYLKITPNNSDAARENGASPAAFFGALVERFGARRVMWGSNYPAHWDKYGTIDDRLPRMRADLAFLGEAALRWIFGETALGLWPELRSRGISRRPAIGL